MNILSKSEDRSNENRGPGDEEEDDEDGVGDPRLPNLHRNKLGVRLLKSRGLDLQLPPLLGGTRVDLVCFSLSFRHVALKHYRLL